LRQVSEMKFEMFLFILNIRAKKSHPFLGWLLKIMILSFSALT
jgi:hypothetical protein